MIALSIEAACACSSQRYLALVHDLLMRYRCEAAGIALELEATMRDLAALEDSLRRPEVERSRELLAEHDRVAQRIELLERDLAHARDAARGAQAELEDIEAALAID